MLRRVLDSGVHPLHLSPAEQAYLTTLRAHRADRAEAEDRRA